MSSPSLAAPSLLSSKQAALRKSLLGGTANRRPATKRHDRRTLLDERSDRQAIACMYATRSRSRPRARSCMAIRSRQTSDTVLVEARNEAESDYSESRFDSQQLARTLISGLQLRPWRCRRQWRMTSSRSALPPSKSKELTPPSSSTSPNCHLHAPLHGLQSCLGRIRPTRGSTLASGTSIPPQCPFAARNSPVASDWIAQRPLNQVTAAPVRMLIYS